METTYSHILALWKLNEIFLLQFQKDSCMILEEKLNRNDYDL